MKLLYALPVLGSLLSLPSTASEATAPGAAAPESAPRVLYLYGDVSAEGDVPSGNKPPFHQMRLDDTGARGMSGFRAALAAVGFQVEQQYDAEVTLTRDFLDSWQVLILGSNQRRFSSEEADAVGQWVRAGGGLVAWSDSAFGGHFREVGLDNPLGRDSNNDLTAQFGMHFLTDNGGGNYLVSEYTGPHYLNGGRASGGVRFRGEGVSPVRVSPPARMLAPLQEGGLGGRLKVNRVDAPFDPQADAALAVAEPGKGRVVGTFDRNTFWNAGEGTRLAHEQNLEFAQRLILWAAGREDVPLVAPAQGAQAETIRVHAGEDQRAKVGEKVALNGRVEGGNQPEVLWSVTRGNAKAVEFENNNPAALETRATFTQPGVYVLVLEVRQHHTLHSGETTITVEE